MLQIEITGISKDGGLKLEENGRPNHGHSTAERNWQVHWRVRPNCGVESIIALPPKPIPGTTNIFSSNPPRRQDPHGKHWRATVNGSAPDYSVYIYGIRWVKSGGGTFDFDPIISIKPSTSFGKALLPILATAAVGFAAYKLFLHFKRKRTAGQRAHIPDQNITV